MAKIVCIDTGTLKTGINEIGDIVAIHDNDVELGSAYDTFRIIHIDMPIEKLKANLDSMIPEVQEVFRIADTNGWTFSNPETKKVWKNSDGDWCDLVEAPKYQLSAKNLTAEHISELRKDSVTVTTTVKENIIGLGVVDKISISSKNAIKVAALNLVTELTK